MSHEPSQSDKSQSADQVVANIAYALHGNCYLNITNRCTLRCRFCPKHRRNWVVQSYDLSLKREPSIAQVLTAVADPGRYHEVVFCGLGEPTQRLDVLLPVARAVKRRGGQVRLNTDGLANLIHGRDVTGELAGCVDRISVSLNAQNVEVYERHTRPKVTGAYPAVLDFVRAARHHAIDVTITAIDGLTGVDIFACRRIATELGVGFRRRLLDDVG
jgi:TatD family-associated radical SAM protein